MSKAKYRYIGRQGSKLHIATDKDGYAAALCGRVPLTGAWSVLGYVWDTSLSAESVSGKMCKKCANYWWAAQEQS